MRMAGRDGRSPFVGISWRCGLRGGNEMILDRAAGLPRVLVVSSGQHGDGNRVDKQGGGLQSEIIREH